MEVSEICAICEKLLGDHFVVVNTEKGLNTLLAKSKEKNDNLVTVFSDVTAVKLHASCRHNYTYRSENLNNKVLRENKNLSNNDSTAAALRSAAPSFQFNKHCLYCGKEASKECEIRKPKERRNIICDVECTDLKSITDIISQKTIDGDNDILLRISGIIDLKSVNAKYHKSCKASFHVLHDSNNSRKQRRSSSVGRPQDSDRTEAFQKLCDFIKNNSSQHFTIQELALKMKDYSSENYYSDKYLQEKLSNYFGDKITISNSNGKQTIICMKEKTKNIIRDSYKTEKNSHENENLKLIKNLVHIILKEIKAKKYDNESYESFDINTINELIPPTLKLFLTILMSNNNEEPNKKLDIKIASVAHCIISAVCPRTFLSPLHVGTGVWLHKKFGSRLLLDMISTLGPSSSYSEILRFGHSATVATTAEVTSDAFLQFIFDNADMNQSTLTGKGTFHCMGGVKTVTPLHAVQRAVQITRIKMTSPVPLNGEQVPLHMYIKPTSLGLRQIKIQNIDIFSDSLKIQQYFNLGILLVSARCLSTSSYLPWAGFMQIAVETKPTMHDQSAIIYLPFINLSPSNPSAVYSALQFALYETKKHNQTTCFTTFDQPLAEKAMDIVAASQPELQGIVVRLGGFHLMFSFVAAISYFMEGSGLSELWSTVYAENSVPHMLGGKAISRALRAHFLTYDSLTRLALKKSTTDLSPHIIEAEIKLNNLRDSKITYDTAANNPSVQKLGDTINAVFEKSASSSRTAALWNQYRKHVHLLRLFIISERIGDWNLHLQCVRQMIPLFHAAGHLNYAKSAHMYLQSMLNLKNIVPEKELKLFTEAGYFTIRRNSKFWSGCWTDLIIEQCLMRAIKSSGGLSRGRGTSDSTLIKWTASMPACTEFAAMLENVTGLKSKSSEQHIDLTSSRQNHDKNHAARFDTWLQERSPLDVQTPHLSSLSSGIVGDSNINCDKADEVGENLLKQTIKKDTNFGDLHLKRKDRVLPLAAVQNSVKIDDNIVIVNHEQIFNRVLCLNLDQTDCIATFGHELAPTSTSLFNNQHAMRTGTKSSLQDVILTKCSENIAYEGSIDVNGIYVIDGGYLLHKVVWPRPSSFETILTTYVNFIKKHYSACKKVVIIFDNYESTASTKTPAHEHRYSKISSRKEIIFTGKTVYSGSQSDFLSCPANKTRLITMITEKLSNISVSVKIAPGDADTMIASTAIEVANESPVYVIASDTDILAILIQRSSQELNITMISPATGRSKKNDKVFRIPAIINKLGVTAKCILFLHAMTGCDTTSAPYRKGKVAAFKLLESNSKLQNNALAFNQRFISREEIIKKGELFLLALYKSNADNLDLARFICYNQIIRESDVKKSFELACLPPTSDAAALHTLRAYHQVQEWLGTSLEPTEWGWRRRDEKTIVPIAMTQDAAPAFILHMISCNCKTDCSSKRCSCKSNGILCSAMCGRCCGFACSNHGEMLEDEIDEVDEELEVETPEVSILNNSQTSQRRKSETLDNSPRKRRTSVCSDNLEVTPLRL